MLFKQGDTANAMARDGHEMTVDVQSVMENGYSVVQTYAPEGSLVGNQWTLPTDKLLRLKKPFFGVRGLVFTSSLNHPDEEGEIITLGNGPKGKQFYRVQFADGATEWFGEDEVLIEVPKPAKSIDDVTL